MKKLSKEFVYDYFFRTLKSKKTSKKIVVFESDDWGMTRSRSKESLTFLKTKYPSKHTNVYEDYDALERNNDILGLIEVLNKHRTSSGSRPVFTLNNVVANPNFDEICAKGFQEYSWEPFTESISKYPQSSSVVSICKQGISEGLLSLEFHGREHVNVNRWIYSLKESNSLLRDAVQVGHITHSWGHAPSGRRDYLDAFGLAYGTQFETEADIIESGLRVFEDIWGFKPKSFIAPCYTWHPDIEDILYRHGIRYLQGNRVQRVPHTNGSLDVSRIYNWQGKKHKSGLISITRNVDFEPVTAKEKTEYLENKVFEIDKYLQNNMPVVISTHRVNYIGRIDENNRSLNLFLLDELIKKLIDLHPDLIFMPSSHLGALYKANQESN